MDDDDFYRQLRAMWNEGRLVRRSRRVLPVLRRLKPEVPILLHLHWRQMSRSALERHLNHVVGLEYMACPRKVLGRWTLDGAYRWRSLIRWRRQRALQRFGALGGRVNPEFLRRDLPPPLSRSGFGASYASFTVPGDFVEGA